MVFFCVTGQLFAFEFFIFLKKAKRKGFMMPAGRVKMHAEALRRPCTD